MDDPLNLDEGVSMRRAWDHPEVRPLRTRGSERRGEVVVTSTLHRIFGPEVTAEDAECPARHVNLDPRLEPNQLLKQRGRRLVRTELHERHARPLLRECPAVHIPAEVRGVHVADVGPPLLPRAQLLAHSP
jgi:hypothetical protein